MVKKDKYTWEGKGGEGRREGKRRREEGGEGEKGLSRLATLVQVHPGTQGSKRDP